MALDLSPILPASVLVVFRGRRCDGLPSDSVPAFYKRTTDLADLTLTDTAVKVQPLGVTNTLAIVHDTAVALYAIAGGDPSNKTTLDMLAKAISQDYYDYRSQSFDIVLNGTCAVVPNGLLDLISFRYDEQDQCTRLQTIPWSGAPEEMQHFDPAAATCDDAHNSGNPVSRSPCVYIYAPPESCVGGGAKATATVNGSGHVTSIAVTNGGTYTGTPTVAFSEHADSNAARAQATATVSGGHVTSVAVTSGGDSYSSTSPPVVSFNGGGAGLQRSRYVLCIEDGRLVSRFVSYDTVS